MSDFKVNDVVKNVYLTEVYYTENGKYLISIKELDGDGWWHPILNNRFSPYWFELQVDKTRDYKLNQILNENL